jgi:hypothetical protein
MPSALQRVNLIPPSLNPANWPVEFLEVEYGRMRWRVHNARDIRIVEDPVAVQDAMQGAVELDTLVQRAHWGAK